MVAGACFEQTLVYVQEPAVAGHRTGHRTWSSGRPCVPTPIQRALTT